MRENADNNLSDVLWRLTGRSSKKYVKKYIF